jgi:hypothetical protein
MEPDRRARQHYTKMEGWGVPERGNEDMKGWIYPEIMEHEDDMAPGTPLRTVRLFGDFSDK